MKRGFTLVELLIVVVVITILMAIAFKITRVAEDPTARNVTVVRLQALENAIGGYYAAFGSYPPVPLHASRDIRPGVNCMFLQQNNTQSQQTQTSLDWYNVRAACQSQPLGMSYPAKKMAQPYAEKLGEQVATLIGKKDGRIGERHKQLLRIAFGATVTTALMKKKENEWKAAADQKSGVARTEWGYVQCFRFGLMSFLLPRYLLMMNGPDESIYDELDQWGHNNTVPCRFDTGVPYDSWAELAHDAKSPQADDGVGKPIGPNYWKVALLPSQIVTTRWIANFEKMLAIADPSQNEAEEKCLDIYGVNVACEYAGAAINRIQTVDNEAAGQEEADLWVYSSGDTQQGNSITQTYALDGITCFDGWGHEFYYYSPAPYQGYRIWSAGKNGRTFPPWVTEAEIDKLSTGDAKIARRWKKDDIVHMNN